jgi:hypothetical protein
MKKRAFVMKDNNKDTYRIIASNTAHALEKMYQEHGIKEEDIATISSSGCIGSFL